MYHILIGDELFESFDTREEARVRMQELLADKNRPAGEISLQIPLTPELEEIQNRVAEEEVRKERDYRLINEVDPLVTNPLRWGDLSVGKQQEWKDYRKELLDITNQDSFPHEVIWPVKPD